MAYEGDILAYKGQIKIDFSDTWIVAVSGDGPNFCGHLLIYAGGGKGYYFHVTGDPKASGVGRIRGYPMYMDDAGFARYLRETGKLEIRRQKVNLPNPQAAATYVESLLGEKWTWGVLPHNCVAFVEEVIAAGGGDWGSYSNCPVVATSDTVAERIQKFFNSLEGEIYHLYGVPQ